MGNGREQLHAGLVTLLANGLDAGTTLVRRNAEAPSDWDTFAETHPSVTRVVIVRDGNFKRVKRTGQTLWTHYPAIEGHVRGDGATEIGTPSNALLDDVLAILDADDRLGGLCLEHEVEMPEEPELNTEEPTAGSLFAWRLVLAALVSETTES